MCKENKEGKKEIDEKKAREKIILEKFKAIYDDFPIGNLIPSESPDFWIEADGRCKIGIEFTELVRGGSQVRKQEKFVETLFEKVQKLFESRNPRVKLLLSISHNIPRKKGGGLSNSQQKDLVNLLVQLIEREYQIEDIEGEWESDGLSEADLINNYIFGISFMRLSENDENCWDWGQAYYIDIYQEMIQFIISAKENKLSNYRKECNEIWLVICSGITHYPSSDVSTRRLSNWVFDTNFDRVLFYDAYKNKVFLLHEKMKT